MSAEPLRLFISLYLDENISRRLAALLRAEGFDAVSALELSQVRGEWSDEKQLAHATHDNRAILTRDRTDFLRLASEYGATGRIHSGIIVTEQLPLGEMLRRTLQLLDSITADEMRNTVRFLSNFADRG